MRGDASYQLRVRALSSSGATIETLTEPVSLRALPAADGADISIYAEAVYPQIAAAGDAPVDVYIVNEGGESARDAVLVETATGAELHTFSFLAGQFTTHRRVYVPVSQTGEYAFSLRYTGAAGLARTAESLPVRIEIARGGQPLDAEESAPFSGQSVKLSEDPTFLFMLGGAAVALVALAAALLITSRKQRRRQKEKMAQLRRQRQEELGKTNRFTPVRAAQRKAEKPKGEKDG